MNKAEKAVQWIEDALAAADGKAIIVYVGEVTDVEMVMSLIPYPDLPLWFLVSPTSNGIEFRYVGALP